MVLQLLHRGAPLSRYLSNAHHVHGMCGCCALTQLRSPRRWSRRAKTHGLLVRRHGIFNRLRCAPDQRPTRERAANHGSGLRECRRPLPPACTCSPLTAVLRSTRLCRALPARPPAPPPSAARSPPLSSPPPAFFRRIRALLDAAVLLPRVAARRRGGSRRRPRQLWRRLCSAATIGRLGRATRAAQAAQATLRGSSTRLYPLSWRCRKVARHRLIFFSTAPAHAACVCAAGKS